MTTKTKRPGWAERICYGAGGIGTRIVASTITGFMLIYLTNVALLDVAAVSAIIGVSRFLDGISDIIVGSVIDNTRSRLGRARIWLLRMCLPFALSAILLFNIPSQLPELLKYVYVFIMYNISSTMILTFMQISYYSLVSLISDSDEEHGLLSSIQVIAKTVGSFLGSVAFVRLLAIFTDEPGNQNTQAAYSRSIIVICAVMTVLTLISVFGTRERVDPGISGRRDISKMVSEAIGALRLILREKCWIVLIICNLLVNINLQLLAVGATYYSLYILNDMNYMSLILMTSMIPTMIILFALPVLTRRFGKQRLFVAGLVIAVAGLAGIGLTSPSIKLIMSFNVLYGVGSGLVKGIIIALLADLIAYTDRTTGQFIAGAGNAGISATEKLAYGLGNILFGGVLAAAGFDAALASQPAAACNAISMLFIWIPLLLFVVVMVLFLKFFDLERKMTE